jgi:DOPA 4,5-dioxygenase
MFEVKLTNNAEFGEFVPWLVLNRGPHSALVHPQTGDDFIDHAQYATWLGQPLPLDMTMQNRWPNDLYPPHVELK